MSTTYAQKQAHTQKKDAPTASSVLDSSSQSEGLQRKADMASTIQCYGMVDPFRDNHTLESTYLKNMSFNNEDEKYRTIAKKRPKNVSANSILTNDILDQLKGATQGTGNFYGKIESVKCNNVLSDGTIEPDCFCNVWIDRYSQMMFHIGSAIEKEKKHVSLTFSDLVSGTEWPKEEDFVSEEQTIPDSISGTEQTKFNMNAEPFIPSSRKKTANPESEEQQK